MKMVVVVCPEGHHEDFRNSVKAHGIHAYTEMKHAVGEGETGKKFGNRLWPDESIVTFMVVDDEKKSEITHLVHECQSRLLPAEGMRAFILPVEEVL